MRINLASSHQGIERIYYLAVLVLLLAVVIVTTGCDKAEKSGGTAQPAPSPAAGIESMGDTPIIISGGSIHLDFNQKLFMPCATSTPPQPCPTPTSATEKVYWAKDKISKADIYDDDPDTPDTPLPLRDVAGKCTITIKGKLGAQEGDITIKSIPATAGAANEIVTVQFDPNKFVKRGSGYRHTNKKLKIEDVVVIDNQGNTKHYNSEPGYPRNKKMTIEIQ